MVWLKEFKRLENVSSAIDPVTGVDEDLAMTIRKYIVPGQQLAVGKPEYKTIIEDKLVSVYSLMLIFSTIRVPILPWLYLGNILPA